MSEISNETRKEIILSEFFEILKKKMPYITDGRAHELAEDCLSTMANAAEKAGIKEIGLVLDYIEKALENGEELIAGEL